LHSDLANYEENCYRFVSYHHMQYPIKVNCMASFTNYPVFWLMN
jgi:hypothetical protein